MDFVKTSANWSFELTKLVTVSHDCVNALEEYLGWGCGWSPPRIINSSQTARWNCRREKIHPNRISVTDWIKDSRFGCAVVCCQKGRLNGRQQMWWFVTESDESRCQKVSLQWRRGKLELNHDLPKFFLIWGQWVYRAPFKRIKVGLPGNHCLGLPLKRLWIPWWMRGKRDICWKPYDWIALRRIYDIGDYTLNYGRNILHNMLC
jgi:hypothetical protein